MRGRRPAAQAVPEEEKWRLVDCGTQFETTARREAIEPLFSSQAADNRTERTRRDGLFQRPEQILLARRSNHQHTVSLDAEARKSMSIEPAEFLSLPARAAKTKGFTRFP